MTTSGPIQDNRPFVITRNNNPVPYAIEIALINPTEQAETIAAFSHDEAMRSSVIRRLSRSFTETYLLQNEKRKILNMMVKMNDFYEFSGMNELQKEAANDAILKRVEFSHLHRTVGESEIIIQQSVLTNIQQLMQEFLQNRGLQDRDEFERRMRGILLELSPSSRRKIITVNNAWSVVEAMRAEHPPGLNYTPQLRIKAAAIVEGQRTIYEGSPLDKLVRTIRESKFDILTHPLVFAVSVFAAKKILTGSAFSLLGLLGVGSVSAGLAALREKYAIQREWVQHVRRSAISHTFDPHDMGRVQMDVMTPNMLDANKTLTFLLQKKFNLIIGANLANTFSLADASEYARYLAYQEVSDEQHIDLIKFSSFENIARERLELDMHTSQIEDLLNSYKREGNPYIDQVIAEIQTKKAEYIQFLHLDIARCEKILYRTMSLRKNPGKVALFAAVSGIILGEGVQFGLSELFHRDFQPIPISHPKTETQPISNTSRTFTLTNGFHITAPQDVHVIQIGNSTYDLQVGTHVIPHAIIGNTVDPHAITQLHELGYTGSSKEISHTIMTTKNFSIPTNEYLSQQNIHETAIASRTWVTNNSQTPDMNELGLDYTSQDQNTVVWSLHMSQNGSFIGHTSYNVPELVQSHQISVLLSYADKNGNLHTYAVPVNADGNAIITRSSPLWNIFVDQHESLRATYAEVAQINGSHATVFATQVGQGNVDQSVPISQPEITTKTITSITISKLPQTVIYKAQNWQMAFLPLERRRHLGRMARPTP